MVSNQMRLVIYHFAINGWPCIVNNVAWFLKGFLLFPWTGTLPLVLASRDLDRIISPIYGLYFTTYVIQRSRVHT